MFYRLHTDGVQTPVPLENAFAGPLPSACWLIGGGPSLAALPLDLIRSSPIPRMSINLAGARLLPPTFWTSYDPTARFHRSIYLNPGILKFVHRRRALDLVPETHLKVCDCPALFFFDRDPRRGFHNFLHHSHTGIVDWADSLVQAIDILYRLGFRKLFLAGCEMQVRPSREQIQFAARYNVAWKPGGKLQDFLRACRTHGVSTSDLDALPPAPLYHFDEFKPISAAAQTDAHYFRIAQSLRLSQRSLALAGMQLVSVTPHSRLNDFLPYQPVRRVVAELRRTLGDPRREPTRGLYRQEFSRRPKLRHPMQDVRPCHWSKNSPPPSPQQPSSTLPPDLLIEAEGFAPLDNHASPSTDTLHQLLAMRQPDVQPHEDA